MDRRVKYTKQIIKESFVELLRKKEINKITVSELCELADINRATFYRYYIDIYDLLEKVGKELVENLKKMLADYKDSPLREVIKAYLLMLKDNSELTKMIFSNNKNISFFNDFFEYIYYNYKIKQLDNVKNINESDTIMPFIFIFNGALGVINYWIQNDFEDDIDKISELIEKTSYTGLYGYFG